MELTTVWFVLVAVLWTGYLVLEGFDFGVGMLLPVLGRDLDEHESEERKRLLLTTIGPHWDGNEVWLITAIGAMFAAFPAWYATLFSGLYLPMLLVLLVVIVRNVGLEYRHKRQDRRWTRNWDRCIVLGSLVAPFTIGTIITAMVGGLPINETGDYQGFLGPMVRPEALLGGLTVTVLAVVHGAFFLGLKTRGSVRTAARRLVTRIAPVALVSLVGYGLWLAAGDPASAALSAVSGLALVAALVLDRRGADGWAFTGTVVSIASIVGAAFVRMFPDAVPSSIDAKWSLSVAEAAATSYTLTIMTWVAVFFLPITFVYSAYSYWVFRRRISTEQLAAH